MIIGVPKEIKNNEYRIAITPSGAAALTAAGHRLLIERQAGAGSGYQDADYTAVGAVIVEKADHVWAKADMVLKVKEPLPEEYKFFRKGILLFTFLHLAAEPRLAQALIEAGVTALAYETLEVNRTLPLLTPMSEVAGRMAVQVGAQFLERPYGGKGVLLSGVPGVLRGKVCIIGGGVVGTNAAKIAIGLGADVTIIDLSLERLRQLEDIFKLDIQTLISNPYNIAKSVAESDLVIGAVLIPGARAPKLVTEDMIKSMIAGSVIVDVAIDQGGIVETADTVTTHDEPIYVKHGVVHYAVANIPGAVPRTATIALTNATAPYVLQIANKGFKQALQDNAALRTSVNIAGGFVTHEAVAKALNAPLVPLETVLASGGFD